MKLLKFSFISSIFIFLYTPIAILVVNSFNDSKYGYEWKGFTWKWYEKLFENEALTQAFFNSLLVAVLAASAATIIGTLMALAQRHSQRLIIRVNDVARYCVSDYLLSHFYCARD